jgi:hypothetical protein
MGTMPELLDPGQERRMIVTDSRELLARSTCRVPKALLAKQPARSGQAEHVAFCPSGEGDEPRSLKVQAMPRYLWPKKRRGGNSLVTSYHRRSLRSPLTKLAPGTWPILYFSFVRISGRLRRAIRAHVALQ